MADILKTDGFLSVFREKVIVVADARKDKAKLGALAGNDIMGSDPLGVKAAPPQKADNSLKKYVLSRGKAQKKGARTDVFAEFQRDCEESRYGEVRPWKSETDMHRWQQSLGDHRRHAGLFDDVRERWHTNFGADLAELKAEHNALYRQRTKAAGGFKVEGGDVHAKSLRALKDDLQPKNKRKGRGVKATFADSGSPGKVSEPAAPEVSEAEAAIVEFIDFLLQHWATLEGAFAGLDENRSGAISFLELSRAIKERGFRGDVKFLWRRLDSDKNGAIDLQEFMNLRPYMLQAKQREHFRKAEIRMADNFDNYSEPPAAKNPTFSAMSPDVDNGPGSTRMSPEEEADRRHNEIFPATQGLQAALRDNMHGADIRVTHADGDLAACNGDFRLIGMHERRDLYMNVNTGAIIYFNWHWKMQVTDDTDSWCYGLPGSEGTLPTMGSWQHVSEPNRFVYVSIAQGKAHHAPAPPASNLGVSFSRAGTRTTLGDPDTPGTRTPLGEKQTPSGSPPLMSPCSETPEGHGAQAAALQASQQLHNDSVDLAASSSGVHTGSRHEISLQSVAGLPATMTLFVFRNADRAHIGEPVFVPKRPLSLAHLVEFCERKVPPVVYPAVSLYDGDLRLVRSLDDIQGGGTYLLRGQERLDPPPLFFSHPSPASPSLKHLAVVRHASYMDREHGPVAHQTSPMGSRSASWSGLMSPSKAGSPPSPSQHLLQEHMGAFRVSKWQAEPHLAQAMHGARGGSLPRHRDWSRQPRLLAMSDSSRLDALHQASAASLPAGW